MKKQLLIGFFLMAGTYVHAVPSYQIVMRELFSHYIVPNYGRDTDLVFQKKPDGWHIAKTVFDWTLNYNVVVREELFWSASSALYGEVVMFEKGETPQTQIRITAELSQATPYAYERCPYYGYDGWPLDVIADFGGIMPPTNDTILEGLGRAYDAYALGFVRVQYIKDQKLQLNLSDSLRCEGLKKYQEGAIRCFDLLRKRNLHFQTIVGEVSTTYYNTIVEYYNLMTFFDRQKEVEKYFTEDFYDPFMRSIAEGQLNNCDSSGIVFTWGNTDTYPMWYLQWVKGIRKDVTVICGAFLNLPEYINLYRFGRTTSENPIAFSIQQTDYVDAAGYFFSSGKNMGEIDAINGMLGHVGKTTDNVYRREKVCFRPCVMVFYKSEDMLTDYELLTKTDSIHIPMNAGYYTTGDMAILDIVASNYTTRPIYFTMSYPDWLLNDHLVQEGLIERFIPARLTHSSGWIRQLASYKKLGEKSISAFPGSAVMVDSSCARLWVSSYRIAMFGAAEALVEKDPATASRIMKTADALFSYQVWFNANIDVYAAMVYYKLNRSKEGDQRSKMVLDICENRMKLKNKLGLQDDQADSIVFSIMGAAEKAGSKAVADRARRIRATYWRPK